MPQFRQNPVTGQWVIVAPKRANRPLECKADRQETRRAAYVRGCPFCPGQERHTPPEVYAVRDDFATVDREGWRVRVFPNKYPALTLDAEGVPAPEPAAAQGLNRETNTATNQSVLRVARSGVGMHEVIVESPAHDKHFALQDPEQAERIVQTLRHRHRMIMQARDVKHVCIFKNHGTGAGASIGHPHFQIIAPAVIPPVVKAMIDRQAAYARESGRALFDALLEEELAAGERIVTTNDAFVALAPWASQLPYELWIVPREQAASFGDLPEDRVAPFAAILHDALLRMVRLLDDPSYHLVIHSSPKWQRGLEVHRWFVQITPRMTTPAGFEFGTHMLINQTPPEQAAIALREVQPGDGS
jgi:UDPglucose--hexose-1-phosphate uridylyltransferase